VRRVQRGGVLAPASLVGAGRAGPAELGAARPFFHGPVQYDAKGRRRAFPFSAYKGDDVRHTLDLLFHGKCAYCEARYEIVGPVDIEHYRPKGAVDGDAGHRGYWWLGAAWENLLPSCIDCNRRRFQLTPVDLRSLTAMTESRRVHGYTTIKTGKEASFPIEGLRVMTEIPGRAGVEGLLLERALLLHPCDDDPREHLSYWIDRSEPLGLVLPKAALDAAAVLPPLTGDPEAIIAHARAANVSVRGAVSIQIYGLNRLGLVQERTRLLRRLEFLGGMLVDTMALADEIEDALPRAGSLLALLTATVDKLRAVADRAMAEIDGLSKPTEAFSEMVRQWIAVFRSELQMARETEPLDSP
jgi:hypothetical protein